jgi:Uma2 family endonuclease
MATVTRTIGRADHGRRMRFADFIDADFEEGWLYELARGRIVVTNVPGPSHGRIVMRLEDLLAFYGRDHPGIIKYRASGSGCRIRLPTMVSDRHPDVAVYLTPEPTGPDPWTRWVPALVVEVISRGSRRRDDVEKRDEYLRVGVLEYWVIDPKRREMSVHSRAGDTWEIATVRTNAIHRTHLLPGLEVRPADLIGPTTDL